MSKVVLSTLLMLGLFGSAVAGDFRVYPITAHLGGERTARFTVANDAQEKLSASVEAKLWTQDENGRDVYGETSDLIYFPYMLQVPPGTERTVRVGIKMAPTDVERCYRLFIEEIPQPRQEPGAAVSVNIRFGAPVFVQPRVKMVNGQIAAVRAAGGKLAVAIENAGNVHVVLRTVTAKYLDGAGAMVAERSSAGWYLLSGVTRTHSLEIPADQCSRDTAALVVVEADEFTLEQTTVIEPSACRR